MRVLINSSKLVTHRIYDDSNSLRGMDYIIVPDKIELNPDKEYAFVNDKFIEVSYINETDRCYFEPELKDAYNNEIKNLSKYLSDTDYITNKFNELVLLTQELSNEDFIIKYKDILDKRSESRKRINELEDLLAQL